MLVPKNSSNKLFLGDEKIEEGLSKVNAPKARAKRRSRKYIYVGTSVATGLLLGLTPISIATPFFQRNLHRLMQR